MAKEIIYRDLSLDLIPNPISKDITTKNNEDAVKRSIRNLLLLKRNEKPFHSEINSGISDLLFENANPLTLDAIKETVTRIISIYEPRVKIELVEVIPNLDGNSVIINLQFYIINLQKTASLSVSLIRTR